MSKCQIVGNLMSWLICIFIFQAYSLHDREVGYCQGSGFIVGLLLMQVQYIGPDRHIFSA